jgi:hypothetical protein
MIMPTIHSKEKTFSEADFLWLQWICEPLWVREMVERVLTQGNKNG